MEELTRQVISPEGLVKDPTNWNRLLKFITGRIVLGQSMRAGNLAGIMKKDFLDLSVEEVGDKITVVVPIRKHKVQKYNCAYMCIPLKDYECFILPLVLAANQRAVTSHQDRMLAPVFVTKKRCLHKKK